MIHAVIDTNVLVSVIMQEVYGISWSIIKKPRLSSRPMP